MKIEERFRENLKGIRSGLGWTQSELGEKCGLTAAHISHFEAGHRVPTIQTLEKLMNGIYCSYHELLD